MKLIALIVAIFAIVASVAGVKNAMCGLKHSVDGDGRIACAAFMPSWSYNAKENTCVEFVYGGCGGNENRFGSQAECEKMCKE